MFQDVAELSEKLPNLIANMEVVNPLYNHMDFIWAEDAKAQVYDRILEVIKKYVTWPNKTKLYYLLHNKLCYFKAKNESEK